MAKFTIRVCRIDARAPVSCNILEENHVNDMLPSSEKLMDSTNQMWVRCYGMSGTRTYKIRMVSLGGSYTLEAIVLAVYLL
jgi:hypothetical protein